MNSKIDKDCDLNSISVHHPLSSRRRSGGVDGDRPRTADPGGGVGEVRWQMRLQKSMQWSLLSEGDGSTTGICSQFSQDSLKEFNSDDECFSGENQAKCPRRGDHSTSRRETRAKCSSITPSASPFYQHILNCFKVSWWLGWFGEWFGISVNVHSTRPDTEASEARNGFSPQEVETAAKVSCPPLTYATEEIQMLESFSSSKSMHKQSSSSVSDHKCQLEEALDNRIAKMEASLDRFGIILDSVQTDLMRINMGTKGISLELEAVREKLIAREDAARVMNFGQAQIRTSLDTGFRTIMELLSKIDDQDKLQETLSAVLAFTKHMEPCLLEQKDEIQRTISSELQALTRKLSDHHKLLRAVLESVVDAESSSQTLLFRNSPVPVTVKPEAPLIPKPETGSWASVMSERAHLLKRNECMEWKRQRVSSIQQDGQWRGLVNLDEVPVSDSSCSTVENGTEDRLIDEVKKETEYILREARRNKRKQCNSIIIN